MEGWGGRVFGSYVIDFMSVMLFRRLQRARFFGVILLQFRPKGVGGSLMGYWGWSFPH